jgi:hypothetical protein
MANHERHSGNSPEHVSFTLEGIAVEQHWFGVVDEVHDDKFDVALTNSKYEQEFMAVDKSQVSENDQPHIRDGAAFDWIIGHVDDTSGRRIGVSIIQFMPPQPLSEGEKQAAMQAGHEMSQALIAGESHRTTFDEPQEGKV